MKRFLTIALTALAMLLVAAFAAMISLRLAIHGREVAVPNLAGLTDADAAAAARKLGLNLSVENRFYSAAVPANHVLSQAPAAGARVRRGWQVRVTESLGGQNVAVPDLQGESERPALLMLSRLQLDLAPEARLPAPGPPGIVLAQSPPPNIADATGPRVALLVSGPEADPGTFAYVMPRITGMTIAAATDLLATAGLHLASTAGASMPPAQKRALATGQPASAAKSVADPTGQTIPHGPAVAQIVAPSKPAPTAKPETPAETTPAPAPVNPGAIIAMQYPQPGNHVTRADTIHVTIAHPAAPSTVPPQQ